MSGTASPGERRAVRDFWVHVHGKRQADFERTFGTTIVPVTTPGPHTAFLPGFDEPQLVYLLAPGDSSAERDAP